MSNQQPVNISDRLRLGIEAARTGRENEARGHLIAVLKQDANNIPAMLWLAFVLPSPEDTIRLLKRVLALEPDNERAKAGIRWARVRLGLPTEQANAASPVDQPEAAQAGSPAAEDTLDEEDPGEDSIRSLLLSEEVQQQAKKGALAHRARRTINPFLGILLLAIAVTVMAVGLRALLFGPTETLAAWIPAAAYNTTSATAAETTSSLQEAEKTLQSDLTAAADSTTAQAPQTVSKSFTSDKLVMPEPPPHIYQPPAEAEAANPSTEAETAAAEPSEVNQAPFNPAQLIGPVGPFPPEKSGAVDPALLAHQPAYPGEKWIEVNVTTQQVTAWEGDVPVMNFTVSTGLPNTPTVLGKFNIYWKLSSTLMVGNDYYLPEVPYTMYFYAGYALHGTYWHSNFGQPMSHGCVNLETSQAKQLFDWATPVLSPGQTEVVSSTANPGTLVVVHE